MKRERLSDGLRVMSVLQLTPRKLGSFEEYTVFLSRALSRRGGKSILVFPEMPAEPLVPLYREAGAVVETKHFASLSYRSAKALYGLIEKHQPDVVHFHFVNMFSLDVAFTSLTRRLRVVFSEHASDPLRTRGGLKQQLLRLRRRGISAVLDKVVAPSNYVRDRLIREGVRPWKIDTIYNGVNLERFDRNGSDIDIRAKYGIPVDSLLVTSIAYLIPEKGISYLIDAAGQILTKRKDIYFTHIGDGPSFELYHEKIKSLGIEKHFILTGLISHLDMNALLKESDIFTLPCIWGEAFSLVILEGMAAGKPIIVTNVGGNPEAVEHGKNGFIVPPGNATKLAETIEDLYEHSILRKEMGEESKKRSLKSFSLDRWVEETIQLYRQLDHWRDI